MFGRFHIVLAWLLLIRLRFSGREVSQSWLFLNPNNSKVRQERENASGKESAQNGATNTNRSCRPLCEFNKENVLFAHGATENTLPSCSSPHNNNTSLFSHSTSRPEGTQLDRYFNKQKRGQLVGCWKDALGVSISTASDGTRFKILGSSAN